ncbi:lysophospholipid acyltransferase family protein [Anaerocolumna sp. MB42-C2]|uniref:lysophospholipid acyltransferase family protein n=1 Tax=Anaerocolumna sp. MB42-C2 TaxID=3070997 RepID=UPI0027E1D15C|nr:1-acyl-sn-glycerol-3-phosphate acyltransferase [Anaerocolumna sp. MB42-C2]WMJ86026.1 1-acyl-sn-glycerol-3-phosphate acyltransferase [Anaerocolumna sp. MB42-C2]
MHLFNASSLFNEDGIKELISIAGDPDKLRNRIIEAKKMLLKAYNFQAYHVPEDFTAASYIIATNHLTDSDAPLIMSYYYEIMHPNKDTYPELFVFAKEDCFNGVSIPKELKPILEFEKVFAVDRKSTGGSFAAIKTAEKWFTESDKSKHFLIFPQGTIYDINKDRIEDIERGAFWLAKLLGIPVLPAFIEQAVEGAWNRLVFGKPISIPKDCRDFDPYKKIWLERVIGAQNELVAITGLPAREAVLDDEHQIRKRFKPI